MLREPSADRGVLARGIVVENEVALEPLWDLVFEMKEEAEELPVSVPGIAPGEDRSRSHIDRSQKLRRAVAIVVVGNALQVSRPCRKNRRGPLPGLNLA